MIKRRGSKKRREQERLKKEQERKLRKAGWKAVAVRGDIYWRHPDTGHLYPRRPALYVEDQRQEQNRRKRLEREPRDRNV